MNKGLEALKFVKELPHANGGVVGNYTNKWDIIENHLKALEIIKNKQIDVWLFNSNDNFNDYNWAIELCYHREKASDYYLTEEEYELLKEVIYD